MHPNTVKGFSIIEIIIACAIFLGTVAAFVTANDLLREIATKTATKTEAALLMEEGAEALLLLRDQGWDAHIESLNLETPYYLYWDGDSYELSLDPVLVSGGYWRRVTLFEVRRDGSGAFAEAGTVDIDTRRAEIEIVLADSLQILTAGEMLIHNIEE